MRKGDSVRGEEKKEYEKYFDFCVPYKKIFIFACKMKMITNMTNKFTLRQYGVWGMGAFSPPFPHTPIPPYP
jgi:hypothetical protein